MADRERIAEGLEELGYGEDEVVRVSTEDVYSLLGYYSGRTLVEFALRAKPAWFRPVAADGFVFVGKRAKLGQVPALDLSRRLAARAAKKRALTPESLETFVEARLRAAGYSPDFDTVLLPFGLLKQWLVQISGRPTLDVAAEIARLTGPRLPLAGSCLMWRGRLARPEADACNDLAARLATAEAKA